MKPLGFLVAAAIVGLILTGAIRLQRTNSTISIQIDKQQVIEDARKLVEEGKEVIEDVREALDDDDTRRE